MHNVYTKMYIKRTSKETETEETEREKERERYHCSTSSNKPPFLLREDGYPASPSLHYDAAWLRADSAVVRGRERGEKEAVWLTEHPL